MLIDFHVHLFPDALAAKTLPKLAHIARDEQGDAPYYTDGTLADTQRRMNEWGVDAVVTQHIATSAHAMHKVNDFAAAVRGSRVYSFGSVHPDAPDALEELMRIKALGLDGVKLHPDYQDFFVDDERMAPLYEKMAALQLPVLFHAGWDPLSPETVHAEPERLARVADGFPKLTIIAAHLGGMRRYDEAEKHLLGRSNLYLDTAMTAAYLDDTEQYARILRGHGLDRVLFATDCPWSTPARELGLLNRLDLSDTERAAVLAGNALRLLGEPELVLLRPDELPRETIEDFAREFAEQGEEIIAGGNLYAGRDIDQWLEEKRSMEREETVPAGFVPSSTLMSVRRSDGRIVGIVNIRHRLNDKLLAYTGHIGYSIRPSERRKGYAKEQLRLALKRADTLCGTNRLLITCDRDNPASAATIRALGGKMENEVPRPDGGVTQRYWIELTALS